MMTSTFMAVFVFLAVLTDPKIGWHNAFKRLKHDMKAESEKAESEHPDFYSEKEDEANMHATDLQQQGKLTFNIGLGVADTFA